MSLRFIVWPLMIIFKVSIAFTKNSESSFANRFLQARHDDFTPSFDLFPPLTRYAAAYDVTTKWRLGGPELLTPDIEQYEGERHFKAQRKHGLTFHHLAGSGSTTSNEVLHHTLAANRFSGIPHGRHYDGFQHFQYSDNSPPRYRYTQVGLSYGLQESFHHKDGGYGPHDPHGVLQYEAFTSRA